MKYTDYCSRCKAKNVPLSEYSKGKAGTTQYHICRDCNRKRQRDKYRTPHGYLSIRKALEKSRAANPEKVKARSIISVAVATKKIDKPANCQECSSTGRIEGHHMDYDKPLEVVWLCTPCHRMLHDSKLTLSVI